MSYHLQGELLEVCDCNTLCPCWVGDDPDNGTCRSIVAYCIEKGDIDGTDVSGLVHAWTSFIPGNVLAGGWRIVRYIDDRATPEQERALLRLFRGELGGPVAELATMVGDEVDVRRAPITFTVAEGRGKIRIGEVAEADMEPYRGPNGEPTRLVDSIFSTIPGSPAYVSKASRFRMDQPELGIDLDLAGHNAIQGLFELRG